MYSILFVYFTICLGFNLFWHYSPLPTYGVIKNNPSGNFLTIYWMQTQYILLLGEQVLTIFLCIKRVRLNWNFILNDDKKEEIWPSPMTKAPTPTEMSKGQVTTQTAPQKSTIKQQLRTDLGRSVGVTEATQLVWLTGLRAHLPINHNSRVIKRTHI